MILYNGKYETRKIVLDKNSKIEFAKRFFQMIKEVEENKKSFISLDLPSKKEVLLFAAFFGRN